MGSAIIVIERRRVTWGVIQVHSLHTRCSPTASSQRAGRSIWPTFLQWFRIGIFQARASLTVQRSFFGIPDLGSTDGRLRAGIGTKVSAATRCRSDTVRQTRQGLRVTGVRQRKSRHFADERGALSAPFKANCELAPAPLLALRTVSLCTENERIAVRERRWCDGNRGAGDRPQGVGAGAFLTQMPTLG